MTVPVILNFLDAVLATDHVEVLGDELWHHFACSYRHAGREFCLESWAMSMLDAKPG